MAHCVYLREMIDRENLINECQLHGRCTVERNNQRVASCQECPDKLLAASPDFASTWRDPLAVYDRRRIESDALRGMLGGRSVFLACGGPSARALDLDKLKRRGIWTMAVNNAAGYFPCSAAVSSDPPSKFTDAVWRDPSIMKFAPQPKFGGRRGRIRRKLPEAEWTPCGKCCETGVVGVGEDKQEKCGACGGLGTQMFEHLLRADGERMRINDCPNVWGFKRRSWMQPDATFFLDDHAAWGNQDSGVRRTGEEKTACTMLLGLRLLRYLGASRIFLLGVDFGMDASKGPRDNYAFPEQRDAGACESNNRQFAVVNDWLCRMQAAGVFSSFGVECYNVNETSGLRAFPFVPFDDALELVAEGVDETPDLRDWYAK